MNQNTSNNLLKRCFKNPLIYISSAYVVFLTFIALIGLYYISVSSFTFQNKIPTSLDDSTFTEVELTIQEPKISQPIDIKILKNPSKEILDKGKMLYQQSCSACHGIDGKGDGIAGSSLNPKPRNFSDISNWKNGRKISELFTTLQKGIAGTGMTAYDFIPVIDRINIIHFIRTLMLKPPENSDSEISNLDKNYNLMTGQKIAGQIPVFEAKKIILNSYNLLNKKSQVVSNIFSLEKNDNKGAKLFSSVLNNETKAINFLLRNNIWETNNFEFVNFISNNLLQNGFNTKFLYLNNEEVSVLKSYLTILLN